MLNLFIFVIAGILSSIFIPQSSTNFIFLGLFVISFILLRFKSFSINPTEVMTMDMAMDTVGMIRSKMALMNTQKLNVTDTSGLRHDLDNKLYTSQYTYSLLPGHPTNLSQFTNGPGYLTSEADPSVSAAAKAITSGDVTNWNSKLSSEVDGSTSNEIQSLSGSGTKTISLSSGGGTFVIPDVNASDITMAIGYMPISPIEFNSAISGRVSTGRNITINGVTQDLSADRTWSIPTSSTAYSGGTGISVTGTVITNTSPNVNPTITQSTGIAVNQSGSNYTVTNTAPDQVVSLTGINGIVVSGTYPNFNIGIATPTINNTPGRVLTNTFTPNATKHTMGAYTFTCSVTNPLLAGSSTATIFPEYSTNNGSSWISLPFTGNASTVGVAVAIAITNGQMIPVSFVIPPGVNVRFRSSVTGTASTGIAAQQETYLPF